MSRTYWPDGLSYWLLLILVVLIFAGLAGFFFHMGETQRALMWASIGAAAEALCVRLVYFKRIVISDEAISGPCLDGDRPMALRLSIPRGEARYEWDAAVGGRRYLLVRHASSHQSVYLQRELFSERTISEVRHRLEGKLRD